MALTLPGVAAQTLSRPISIGAAAIYPMTISFFFRNSGGGSYRILGFGNAGTLTTSYVQNNTTTLYLTAENAAGTTASVSVTTSLTSTTGWRHCFITTAGLVSSAYSVSAIVDGGASTAVVSATQTIASAEVVATELMTRFMIGVAGNSSTSAPMAGDIAEVAIFRPNAKMSSQESAALAAGRNPLRMGVPLLCYYPLDGNLNDYGPQKIGLTPGTGLALKWTDHP